MDVQVWVGGQLCRGVQRSKGGSLHCMLPGGVGRGLDVSVTATFDIDGANQSAVSRPNKLFSYHDPQVASLFPKQGRSSGGTRVTIQGQDFGPSNLEPPPLVLFGDRACLRVERYSDSTLTCLTPPQPEAVVSVLVSVGPEDGRVDASGELLFVYVETPAERLMHAAREVFLGLEPRLARMFPGLPLTLHREMLMQGAYEVQFEDVVANSSKAFAVPPHLLDVLPAKDFAKRYKSCAVVGESASLLDAGKASEIDSHQAVLRPAHAPVKSYEKHVGKKTTLRVGKSDYLLSLATVEGDNAMRGQSSFLKQQSLLLSPLFLWDTDSPELLAVCKQPGRNTAALDILLVAPWMVTSAQSLYQKLKERYGETKAGEIAVLASRATTDEATSEQAAAVLAKERGSPEGIQAGADPKGSGEEEGQTEVSEALGGEEDLQGDGDNGAGGDEEEPDDGGGYGRRRLFASRPVGFKRASMIQGSNKQGRPAPSLMGTGAEALESRSSVLADRPLSMEFQTVMLALQVCNDVELYGFPSLHVLQADDEDAADLPLLEETRDRSSTWAAARRYHAYRSDGLYYESAPDHVMLAAMASSGAARLAADLHPSQQGDAPASSSLGPDGAGSQWGLRSAGGRSTGDLAVQPRRAGLADLERLLEMQRAERMEQVGFEAVLWRMMAMQKYVSINSS
eukprot:CAMPEP_0117671470 /NCGR_PEP_ID=MMETSP0804-20121206/13351_1 /TAXON_ID=1074897 /ORGANISM="Tetraselmis astigmatica, Strain CCMP880" /LENGTH=680 /DNA_ID=CAMNT_0005479933 /DNA_START=75 /DNA_END=2117 /DNA_ORIENTATION=+